MKKATNKKKEVAGKDGDDELDNYLATLKVGAMTKMNKDALKTVQTFLTLSVPRVFLTMCPVLPEIHLCFLQNFVLS